MVNVSGGVAVDVEVETVAWYELSGMQIYW
jgi:hypothetical protein